MRNIWQLKIFFIRDTNAIYYQSMDKINLYCVVPESLHYDQNCDIVFVFNRIDLLRLHMANDHCIFHQD